MGNRGYEGKQMTATMKLTDAPSTLSETWDKIHWKQAQREVLRLQMRIAKATREKRHRKAKALQWLLTHSYHAKLLAVKRVTTNNGRNTAGVDGVTWSTPAGKMKAALRLKRRGYNTKPLRRIYIPKSNGDRRPLGIPTMADRAQQALHLLALEPIAETRADPNSYGFRPKRSAADAIEQCFNVLGRKASAQWVLEGDIKACFDRIDHGWLLRHIPMDKTILGKWLKAGYVEGNSLYPTEKGTPQGGIISPVLANMALDGLEKTAKKAGGKDSKVNVVRYADDFIITCDTKIALEDRVKPAVARFLKTRGLELSEEKTKITSIDEGFDFLGFNVRKYGGKLLIKPSKKSIKTFLGEIRNTIRRCLSATTEALIWMVNQQLTGFTNYYRTGVAHKAFGYIDNHIYLAIRSWIRRKHPKKSWTWRRKKYFRCYGMGRWRFFTKTKQNRDGTRAILYLKKAYTTPIRYHVKIRSEATPYDPAYRSYFESRAIERKLATHGERKHFGLAPSTNTRNRVNKP